MIQCYSNTYHDLDNLVFTTIHFLLNILLLIFFYIILLFVSHSLPKKCDYFLSLSLSLPKKCDYSLSLSLSLLLILSCNSTLDWFFFFLIVSLLLDWYTLVVCFLRYLEVRIWVYIKIQSTWLCIRMYL